LNLGTVAHHREHQTESRQHYEEGDGFAREGHGPQGRAQKQRRRIGSPVDMQRRVPQHDLQSCESPQPIQERKV